MRALVLCPSLALGASLGLGAASMAWGSSVEQAPGTGGSGGSGGSGGWGPHPCGALAGFYELSLLPDDPAATPDDAVDMTLELADDGDACRARLTPRFYPTASVATEVLSAAVVLDDSVGAVLPTASVGWYWGLGYFREYHFKEIVLARGPDGAFNGAASAKVDVNWAEDDICLVSEMPYFGTLAADAVAPEIYAGPTRVRPAKRPSGDCFVASGGKTRPGWPEDTLLPWDVVAVEASEALAGLASHVSIAAQGGGPTATSGWQDAPIAEGVTAADTWAWARLTDWDAVLGTVQVVSVADGLVDGVGLALGAQAREVPVLDVGPAVDAHELDGTVTVGTFGQVAIAAGTASVTAPCNSGVGGVAGRILTAGKTKVLMRVRLDNLSSLVATVVGRSGATYAVPSPGGPDPEGWLIAEASIAGESEIGFVLVPNSYCHWANDANVEIDRVWAE
ncbi:MAG: hypothetical protein HY825_20290 [Acidobacteria bacterium]|nr:hypothetical protein [Acidobacteriota bacterium]